MTDQRDESIEPTPVSFRFLTIVVLFCVLARIAIAAQSLSLAVPSYVLPGSAAWQAWVAGSGAVKLMIVNVNNGDDLLAQPPAVAAVRAARAAGVKVLGYTYTRYGQRDAAAVLHAIDAARANYSVDGAFLDEVPTDCGAKTPAGGTAIEYYRSLSAHVHDGFGGITVLNPGVPPATNCWMAVADILVTYENRGIDHYRSQYQPLDWMTQYPSDRFWHLLYGVPTEAEMKSAVGLARMRRAGWLYVTSDGADGNPWDGVPAYWTAETAAVETSGPASAAPRR